MYRLEQTVELPLATSKTSIQVYKHPACELRIVFCSLPGPLVSTSILVPTLCDSNNGAPHTLEHLIFCGSTSIPQRGYLDCLATRCLSTGTNAYTTEDHTNYTLTCAGEEGMIEVLPVFLDHVINPTLRDAQFITEVYHVDGDAKCQGVVYCEMAGREHSESDMVDLALRRLIFGDKTTYSYECGGLTPDIAKLTNQEIITYHQQFYHLNNVTVIICGQVDPQRVFAKLDSMPSFQQSVSKSTHVQMGKIEIPPLAPSTPKFTSETVRFPSSDEQVGSVTYGWRGPPSDDIPTLLALDVLFRYLQDTAASPLAQKFVELSNPLASDVDFDLRGYVQSVLVLGFNGVPYGDGGGDGESDDEPSYDTDHSHDTDNDDDEEDDGDHEEGDDDENMEESHRTDLFEEKVYYHLMRQVLLDFIGDGFPSMDTIQAAILRHRRKLLETLEDDPHDWVMERLVRDFVRLRFGTSASKTRSLISGFVSVLDLLDDLQKKPAEFWKQLVQYWLLDAPCFEVLGIPDEKKAKENADKEVEDRKRRAEEIGPDNLKKLKVQVEAAVKENLPILSEPLKAQMPPVPDVSRAPKLSVSSSILSKEAAQPFGAIQVVSTETAFVHVRLGIDTSGLPAVLKPYLVLFQELLFQIPLAGVGSIGAMDYRDVAKKTSELFISHEASIGFGNDVFHTSWLSEIFSVYGCAERHEWEVAMKWLCRVLTQSIFTEDRVVSIAKNLISEIAETKRDGYSMAVAVMTRITCPLSTTYNKPVVPSNRKTKASSNKSSNTAPSSTRGNDLDISIFRQEAFLKSVLSALRHGNGQTVLNHLSQVRDYLRQAVAGVKSQSSSSPTAAATTGFVQISIPENEFKDIHTVSNAFLRIWKEECVKAASALDENSTSTSSRNGSNGAKKSTRKSGAFAGEGLIELPPSPFPFPRQVYRLEDVAPEFRSVMVPIAGVTASYLLQAVPCDVMKPATPVEKYSVMLLAELLSQTEGPLYTAVRGNGHAYGADLSLAIWTGQLLYEVREASDPYKALLAFYAIIENLVTPKGFEDTCSQFQIDTARAACAYRLCSSRSTAASLISTSLRGAVRGYATLEEEEIEQQSLYKVTKDDLRRVINVYLTRFLDPASRVTVLSTIHGEDAEKMLNEFGAAKKSDYAVKFSFKAVSDFALPLNI
ncbi:hypothetical protein SmJEL517_g04347 [Synchytrium microbalum]|uniref:Peptidase M16 N-terminal domain-containing protein n=1 Tax=Synchytrium microbalum TaxID=1806994 RepID=A0A507C0E2_9FUNG|nr:uncharacterized protein SmJEL517_g04347 [Synchytrium microbalum]TPX32519.1 hypothetical protein SmJEL517_g04347 [Synchytrium microbalum]